MSFTESLTVRILGDSSSLRQELNSVASALEELQQRFESMGEAGAQVGTAVEGLAGATRPIQQLQTLLSGVESTLRSISSTPVTLDVQPALGALQQLTTAAQMAGRQLQMLSAMPPASPSMVPPLNPEAMRAPPLPAFATGGLVNGPPGEDRVLARLTAGEFVLSSDAVSALGLTRLERWNRAPGNPTPPGSPHPRPENRGSEPFGRRTLGPSRTARSLPPDPSPWPDVMRRPLAASVVPPTPTQTRQATPPRPTAPSLSQTTNQFGGIEIHVRESVDVSQLMQDLRRQGIGLRNRRG